MQKTKMYAVMMYTPDQNNKNLAQKILITIYSCKDFWQFADRIPKTDLTMMAT